MTTDNWQSFKEIFQSALEIPVDERPAYLDRVCSEPSLRKEVESLLRCYVGQDKADDGQKKPSPADKIEKSQVDDPSHPHPDPVVETFIDHFHIMAKIGRAKSSALYRAVRIDDPVQTVALRFTRTDGSTGKFLSWLNREQRILRALRHPHIATLLETGFDKKRQPYLVSEFIDGIQIDEYCDSNKLDTRARIVLFIEVCNAIQYGHQHFVAHGSLDNKSVLVTSNGDVKVLNLGLADFLNCWPSSPAEDSGTMPEDSEYTSPSQTRGEPITAAADVYSLGVLLYLLLTGHSPYRIKGGTTTEVLPAIFEAVKPSKILDQIVEETGPGGGKFAINPQTISTRRNEELATVRKRLVGDLDIILLKAIQREPAKRYSTVEQFCGDIQRYLEGRPVSARKNTWAYRVSKFTARHKAGTIAAALGATALIAALIAIVEHLFVR